MDKNLKPLHEELLKPSNVGIIRLLSEEQRRQLESDLLADYQTKLDNILG